MRIVPIGILSCLVFCLWIAPAESEDSIERPRNAAAGVKYIGADKCAECHQDQHESFLETLHSKAAQVTDIRDEPKPAQFSNQASGNLYQVDVVDGQMVHREKLRDPSGKQLAVTEEKMVLMWILSQ